MKRLLAIFLCLSLLLGTFPAFAAGGSMSVSRSNVTDMDPPAILSVKLTENNKTLRPGKTLHVQVTLDDRSEITECFAYFYNKAKDTTIVVELLYDAAADAFTGEHTLDSIEMNGTYLLTSIQASDKYGNHVKTENEKGYAKFKLSGANKNAPLELKAKIKENNKIIKPGKKIHVGIQFSKTYPSARQMEYTLGRLGTDEKWTYFMDYDPSVSKYIDEISLSNKMPNGIYQLDCVYLYDDQHRLIGSKAVTKQQISLKGAGKGVKDPPKISLGTLKENGKKLSTGADVHISAKITKASDIGLAIAYLVHENHSFSYTDEKSHITTYKGKYAYSLDMGYNEETKKFEAKGSLPGTLPDGVYHLVIYAFNGKSTEVEFPKQKITYSSPDPLTEGIKDFITACFDAIFGTEPTALEVRQYGVPLANGKQKAVNVIKTLLAKANLLPEQTAYALCLIMQGAQPASTKMDAAAEALKTSVDAAIDTLNDSVFRNRCKEWGIKPGNLGTKASDTKMNSVDVDNGHYILDGSNATFAGVTDKNITSLTIKDTVKANGKTYKVTKIEGAACKGLKKLTSVTIGKNITTIGQAAFKGCKKLRKITIKTTKLKTIGKDAFSGIHNKAIFVLPSGKEVQYKKQIQEKGNAPKKIKFGKK
jgi:hypothetical protein